MIGKGVLAALESAMERQSVQYSACFIDNSMVSISSRSDMQKHWFGELTNIEGLNNATEDQLYKGGIRNFGEELFE